MLQRVLRQQCLVHVTPQQLPLGSLRRKALGVEAHEALDDDAEEEGWDDTDAIPTWLDTQVL